MIDFMEPILGSIDTLLEWVSSALKTTASSYCDLEAVDNRHTLVTRDGGMLSVLRIEGVQYMVGGEEFERLHNGVSHALATAMSRPGYGAQMLFSYDKEDIINDIRNIFSAAYETAERLQLELDDLFKERERTMSHYCAEEKTFLVLWTFPTAISEQQLKAANQKKFESIKKEKLPPMRYGQSMFASIPDLREGHESYVRSTLTELQSLGLTINLLDVHSALKQVRMSIDSDFTSRDWEPYLPGDRIPVRILEGLKNDASEIMWPALSLQLLPRDGKNISLKYAEIGDKIFAPLFIDLFPKEVKSFTQLFNRAVAANIPWRISFMMESNGLESLGMRSTLAAILSFASENNRLLSDAKNLLSFIQTNTDDAVVKLQVALCTWAPSDDLPLLKIRAAELAKAVQGWGHCEVAEITGDPYGATLSSALAMTSSCIATPSVAPLSDVAYMLPVTRPASPWDRGAMLFRSPDGKPWPYQPGSSLQTTWIDLVYARPGSGKSVLSNAINLALCLNPGQQRLPRIAIIDIGPSSSGLISLVKEALPKSKSHLAAYHRLRMREEYSINPFDTQLGSRIPTPIERSFLVNFISLLVTPLGSERTYDGMTDMVGMVIDELYKNFSDRESPNRYAPEIDKHIDELMPSLGLSIDSHTSWWEITDALFAKGYVHEAMMAQRYAVPLLADAGSICRAPAIADLFGRVTISTGETLVESFNRMISSAIREYPILARPTQFDLGEARVVSLDLDEVAKTGGEAADRQTAVMYMMARYVLARDYYLTAENVQDMPEAYRTYHRGRVMEIREDHKRIVMDEFHRTSKAKAVRDQVIVDMREGRKWKVQVALLSQSLDDFDEIMIDFATSIYIMDAGPAQSIEKSAKVFGLSDTAKYALRNRVHGPREGGGTFLAQFATKEGMHTHLLTNTIGPIELWAFSTTAEDAFIRNQLYDRLGPRVARTVLASMYPSGSIAAVVERRMAELKDVGMLTDEATKGIMQTILDEIIEDYRTNPRYSGMKVKEKQS
jgi:intracellular multiplication protein IcmB